MFNFNGPQVIQPSPRSDDSALVLKLNQRVAAEVLQVNGDNVILAIEGVRVVAKLTSNDQIAALQEHRHALFIIRDINPNQILIQLAPNTPALPANVTSYANQDLANLLLSQLGLATSASNLLILRAMLGRGLAADLASFGEIQSALAGLASWGASEVQAAVALKAAGLPLTPATLQLMMNAPPMTAQAYSRLLSLLQGLPVRQFTPQTAEALQNAIAMLRSASPNWSGVPANLVEQLQQAIALLGQSVENKLAEMSKNGNNNLASAGQTQGLMTLLSLRQELAQTGPREVLQAIDHFLDALRLQQFKSSEPEPAPGRGEWINLHLPLRLPARAGSSSARPPAYCEAQIKIARHRQPDGCEVDPNFTRLIIAVDLENGSTMEVDLSVVTRKIGVAVTASTPHLCDTAKEEISTFAHGLNQLGYDLQTSRFEVGQSHNAHELTPGEILPEKFLAVNLEI